MAPMKGLREHLSDILERCHQRGLVLPYFPRTHRHRRKHPGADPDEALKC
jgi:hypothetical protein